MIFITGGSASGKTTLALRFKKHFGDKAVLISQDSFYKPTRNPETNYDIPTAFDFELQQKVLDDLKKGKSVKIPNYNYELHDVDGYTDVEPKEILIFEGLFTLHDPDVRALADLSIFVSTPADTRLARRILRDVEERGRSVSDVTTRWIEDVQPAYMKHIVRMKKKADIIVPWSSVNEKAVDALLITLTHI